MSADDNIAFTPDALAARWQCSPQHLRDLVKREKLRCFRVGRLYRIPYDVVIEFEKGAPKAISICKPRDIRVVSVPHTLKH